MLSDYDNYSQLLVPRVKEGVWYEREMLCKDLLMYVNVGPQLLGLFGKAVEPLGGANSLIEVSSWEQPLMFYSLAPNTSYSLCTF